MSLTLRMNRMLQGSKGGGWGDNGGRRGLEGSNLVRQGGLHLGNLRGQGRQCGGGGCLHRVLPIRKVHRGMGGGGKAGALQGDVCTFSAAKDGKNRLP